MAARTHPTMIGMRSLPGAPLSHMLSSWKALEDTFVLNASSWTFERVRDAEKCGTGLWVVVVFFVVVVVFFVVVVVFFVVVVVLIVVVVVFFAVVVVGLSVVVVICLMVVVVSPNSLSILHFERTCDF